MKRGTVVTVGLVIAGLLGVSDLIALVATPEGPPVAVLAICAALGALTLTGVFFAWRGSRAGLVTVIVTRLLSALAAVPAFIADDVPSGAVQMATIGIVITLLTVAMLMPALGRKAAAVGS